MAKGKTKTETVQNQTSSQAYELPAYMRNASTEAVWGARERANSPYQQFEGQRIADMSQNEQMGMAAARSNYGASSGDYDKARSYADSVGSVFDNQAFTGDMERARGSVFDDQSFTGDMADARGYVQGVGSVADKGALDGYMNPYIESVLDPQVRRRNEAYGAETAELDRTSGMRGAFGGRRGVAEDQAARRHQEGLSDLYGETYSGAFDRATSLHQAEQDRKLNQAGALTNMAGLTASQRQAESDRALGMASLTGSQFQSEQDRKLQQSGAFTNIAESQSADNRQALRDLMATGHTERTRDQADLDFKYLEHLEKRDWDINNITTLVDVLSSVPHEYSQSGESSSTQTQTVEKKESPLKTIVGIAAIAAGAIMTGGASLAVMGAAMGTAGSSMLGGE